MWCQTVSFGNWGIRAARVLVSHSTPLLSIRQVVRGMPSGVLKMRGSFCHSFVITIDLVSTDSRGGAPSEAFGFLNDTCGQTIRKESVSSLSIKSISLHRACGPAFVSYITNMKGSEGVCFSSQNLSIQLAAAHVIVILPPLTIHGLDYT